MSKSLLFPKVLFAPAHLRSHFTDLKWKVFSVCVCVCAWGGFVAVCGLMNSRKRPGCFTLFCFCNIGSEHRWASAWFRSLGMFLAFWSSFQRRQIMQVRHLYVVLSEAPGAETETEQMTDIGEKEHRLWQEVSEATFQFLLFNLGCLLQYWR